jgi:CRP/FNR family transcriptional regulator
MPHGHGFVLHRPELTENLERGDEKLRRLMAAQTRTIAAGTAFVVQEAEHPFIYRLQSGWAARVRTLPDGRKQAILTFLPDDLFAVKSLFVASHGDAIEALSDIAVEFIDHRKLREAYEADPDIAMRCNWQVVEEERRLHNWIVGLGQGSADERMAGVLLEWQQRLARSKQIAPDASEYSMPMTQEFLGTLLGITTVHVSRVLRKFREEGLAAIRGGKVQLLNMPALERIASPMRDDFERAEAREAHSSDNV